MKIKGITTRGELSIFEADNVRKAIAKYLAEKPTARKAPFNLGWTLKLHKEMFGKVWKWAGSYRKYDTNIGVPWQRIETELYNLLENLATWGGFGTPLLTQAARLHHQAVRIHPFPNGNGRWSRLLANIWLKRHDHSTTDWPEEVIGTESVIRSEYLAAIRAADEGDESLLLRLHQRFT